MGSVCNCYDCQLARADLGPTDDHTRAALAGGEGTKRARLPVPPRPHSPFDQETSREERIRLRNERLHEHYDREKFARWVPLDPLTPGELLATVRRRRGQAGLPVAAAEDPDDWEKDEGLSVLGLAPPGGTIACGCGRPGVARLRSRGRSIFCVSALREGVCCSHLIPEMHEL